MTFVNKYLRKREVVELPAVGSTREREEVVELPAIRVVNRF